MRKTATHTHRLWRRHPARGSALRSQSLAVLSRSSSSAARAPRPAIRRTDRRQWSAPVAWPIVAVHMSLEPTGEVFMLDGFDAAPNSERLWNPATDTFTADPVRAQPLLLRPHPARRRPHADRRRPHRRERGARGHDDLQPADEHVLPRAGHGRSRGGIRRRRSSRTAACSSSPATTSSRTGPGEPPPFSDASVNSLPRGLQPDHEHVDRPHERAADVAALPVHVRALGRPDRRRRARTRRRGSSTPGTWTWSTVATSPFDGIAPSCTGRTRS